MINNQQTLNFGWNSSTHKALTQKVTNGINKINSTKKGTHKFNTERIIKACILPDQESSLKAVPHVADISKLRKVDGLTMFEDFHNRALKSFQHKKTAEFEKNLGIATHYLQDILNPYHVNSTNRTPGKITARLHYFFEEDACHFHHEIQENTKKEYKKPEMELIDFIKHKMRKTKSIKNKLKTNEISKEDAIKESLQNSYEATVEFLNNIQRDIGQ